MLAVLEQNSSADWRELVNYVEVEQDGGGATDVAVEDDDELTSFKL